MICNCTFGGLFTQHNLQGLIKNSKGGWRGVAFSFPRFLVKFYYTQNLLQHQKQIPYSDITITKTSDNTSQRQNTPSSKICHQCERNLAVTHICLLWPEFFLRASEYIILCFIPGVPKIRNNLKVRKITKAGNIRY